MYSAQYGGRSGRAKGKQAKSKKKNKKCTICGTKGHEEDECPENKVQLPGKKNSGGAGSGISHKSSRKANNNKNKGASTADGDEGTTENQTLQLPTGFVTSMGVTTTTVENDPFLFFDAGCDVGATLDTLALLKNKSKANTPTSMYQAALASSASNYGGCLCRQYLKPGRPWKNDTPRNVLMKEADPRIFYVLGLGPRFFLQEKDDDDSDSEVDDSEEEEEEKQDNSEGAEALTNAIETDALVVGVCAKLDYTPNVLELPGYDKGTQLRRFRATCTAALEANVPIQCRIAPGIITQESTSNDEVEEDSASDPHVMVVRDLAKVLLEMSPTPTGSSGSGDDQHQLQIHLASWNGKCKNMLALLQAFPDSLYVGMNASIGFTKSVLAHECAFDVPLNRLLLETDAPAAIPTPVATAMGRAAFCHSGLVPFCAAAVAEIKKIEALYLARIAAENTVRLYGRGVAERAKEAAAEAAVMLVEADQKREEEAAAQLVLLEQEEQLQKTEAEGQEEVVVETKKEKKKKKKKKGQANNGQQQQDGDIGKDAEAAFDEDFLAALVDQQM